MLCECVRIFHIILSITHNILMDLNNVMWMCGNIPHCQSPITLLWIWMFCVNTSNSMDNWWCDHDMVFPPLSRAMVSCVSRLPFWISWFEWRCKSYKSRPLGASRVCWFRCSISRFVCVDVLMLAWLRCRWAICKCKIMWMDPPGLTLPRC